MVGSRLRDTVMWLWSADTLFWQLSIEHDIDVYYQAKHWLQSSTLARKFDISHWFLCGGGGGGGGPDGRARDYQNFSDG